ncbi:MAG TPA: carbon monoxide dehydrogenase [Ktedonobacter sp.]|nr:carbon monoxide dehydrogenase [Ktedonobacter sp.]
MGIAAMVGTPVKRREDPRLITGQATYVDDIKMIGMLHMAVLRSPYGHARINSINTEAARQHPGVVAVYTAEDIKGKIGDIPVAVPLPPYIDKGMGRRGPLAEGKVRFYGDPVAVVIAEDKYTARDAVDLIDVDYEPLPAAIDMEKAMQEGAPLLYEEYGTNVALPMHPPTEDIDKVFAETVANGGVIVKGRIVNQRLAPAPMETRGVVAEYRKADKTLTVWSSSQIPHLLRNYLAEQMKLPQTQVRVIVPEVGGGFGCKLNVYPEEAMVSYAAMKTGRPVKWIEDRSENLSSTIHGRDQINYIEAAADKDGKVHGLKVHVISDLGSYLQFFTDVIAIAFTLPMVGGCYDIPVMNVACDIVFTNKAPTDAYRGAGRPEATFLIERAMDLVAHELGKDPAEVRLTNFIKSESFPHKVAAGPVYDTGNYAPALEKAMELINYKALREEQAKKRAEGKLMGIGVSSYVEICGLGPKGTTPFGVYESARVRVEQSGTVMVYTGISPHGQGQETSFAQLIADEFGVPMDKVLILHGDTDSTPEGRGTYGSRGTSVGGSAVFKAAERIKEKMIQIAAHMLEASPEDVKLEGGNFSVAGSPQKSVTFDAVANTANTSNTLAPGIDPGLEATAFFEPESCTFPFGTHICVVEVDKDTGEAEVVRYVAVDDCGRQLNPMLVQGQVHGGIAQGFGQAMCEGIVYGEDGQLLTASFMDYAMPIAPELPSFELDHTVTPTTVNPLGVKGVGEAGTIGSTPAVAAAIIDALNVDHIDMPMSPEKLWKIIHQQA